MSALTAVRRAVRADPGLALLCLALALAVALYAPTLFYGLSNYDDPWLVRDNWLLRDTSWSTVHAIFFDLDLDSPRRLALTPEYLPVRDLSIMLDFAIYGDSYVGFHVTNLLVYLAAIMLWFAALDAFGIDRKIAGLAVLIWAIHPAHAESVAWITERKGLLGAAFAGAAALGYARFRAGRSARWLALAAIAAVLAVWSKAPSAFAIGALAGLELALPARRVSWRRSFVGLAVIGALAGAAFVPVLVLATSSAVVGTSSAAEPTSRLAMVAGVHGFYVRLAMMAMRNAVNYPLATDGPSATDIAIGGSALVLVLAMALVPRRARYAPSDPLRAAAVLWLFAWLPFSHLVLPLQMVIIADRYALLPTVGFALAIAVGLAAISSPTIRRVAIVAVVLAASARAFDAQSSWSSSRALWSRAVESAPHDAYAWSQYAEALDLDGEVMEALTVTGDGLRVAPSPVLELRQALLLREVGDLTGSIASMRTAAEGGEPKAMSNLALLELDAGHTDEALVWARRGALASPIRAQAQRTLGKVLLAAGHADEALAPFRRAYELEPLFLGNRYNLALALVATGHADEARAHFEACLGDRALGAAARRELDKLETRVTPGP